MKKGLLSKQLNEPSTAPSIIPSQEIKTVDSRLKITDHVKIVFKYIFVTPALKV